MIARRLLEALTVLALSLLVVGVVHDVPYLLEQPFWLDEAWVALSTRLPVTELLSVSSSSPPGWTLLLRPFPAFGEQALRLVPLLFQALTITATYALSRVVLRGRAFAVPLAGFVAVGVALTPALLLRNDLKQYTSDAAFAVLILLLATWASGRPGRTAARVILGATALVAMFFSIASVFVSASAFAAMILALATRRRWRLLLAWSIAAAATLAGVVVLYVLLYARADNESLAHYWDAFYPMINEVPGYLVEHGRELLPLVGIAPSVLALALAALGLALLWVRGLRTTALFFPVLAVVMVAVGVARRYPLLDARTSLFLVVLVGVLALLGVALTAVSVAELLKRQDARAAVIAGVVILALASIVWVSRDSIRVRNLQPEDTRSQVEYMQAHWQPRDVVVTNTLGGFGVAYYLDAAPTISADPALGTGFRVQYAADDPYIVAPDATLSALDEARERARESGGRVWLLLSHATPALQAEWLGSLTNVPYSRVSSGGDPMWLIREDASTNP